MVPKLLDTTVPKLLDSIVPKLLPFIIFSNHKKQSYYGPIIAENLR